ncbi:murein biosynthesis integral membrane protein MurJ [Methylomarinum sp. Ch1-1]|uniref:Probable lipid II flippase MurJ n=1 Tax=Methylomarinum roseum TaxID=3067653 RepID=A0AAU7NXF3_9GAMM|nr:murein biosynthesis integral membrane protein MurJ [Methylomarinum sp. Ch1-1]MDP4522223.1 murein biosynthesis integral membrane protein MurJ [Methylomarinum sp. Ch1-1]
MSRQLFKSTAIVSSMTMISRILGFIRDMLFARIFGVDSATDAFFVAFKIPNFLRRLFAEGAFAQAFVPVLSDYKEQGSREALKLFIDRTGGTLALVLMMVTVVGVVAAPVLITLFAPGFLWEDRQYELAVQMLRITFPYLFFISSVAFAGGILNAHGKFAVPAFTPVFLNLCLIAAALWLAPLMPDPVVALAWGVFAAGLVQLLFQFPALMRLGLLPRLRFGFIDAGVKRIMKLMLPAIFGVSVTQINLLLDTLIASFLAAGSVSWLYYSDRLVEFPLGVFGIALATVILPSLSKNHAVADTETFSRSLDWGLRLVLLIGAPASLGLLLLAEPMLSTLFQYDEFAVEDVRLAGQSLKAYAVGLLGFILVKVLVPGFTSRKDTKTPVRFGIYAMLVNMLLNVALVFPLAHAGLALATSLGAFFNASLLLAKLLKDRIYRPGKQWRVFILRIILANEIMAVFLHHVVELIWQYDWQAQQRIINLALIIATGALVYGLALLLSGFRVRHLSGR